MPFAFELATKVQIVVSGEVGTVQGRCEYLPQFGAPTYFLAYKAADGRAVNGWFNESEIASAP